MVLPNDIAECLLNYEDDFLVMASSQAELEARTAIVIDAIKAIPGGHFNVKVKSKGCLTDTPPTFLGYRIQLKDHELRIEVGEKPELRFNGRANDYSNAVGNLPSTKYYNPRKLVPLATCFMHSVRSFAAAFCAADDIDEYVAFAESEPRWNLATIGKTIDNLDVPEMSAAQLKKFHFEFSA